jgi:integrase
MVAQAQAYNDTLDFETKKAELEVKTGKYSKFLGDYIDTFLDRYKTNTQKAYRKDIVQFFEYFFKREYKDVQVWELIALESNDLNKYQTHLLREGNMRVEAKGEKNKQNTTKRKIQSLISMYKYLASDFAKVRPEGWNSLKKLDDDTERYGVLHEHEAKALLEAIRQEKYKVKEKMILVDLALRTSIRFSALLNLTMNHIFYDNNENVWYINTLDKREKTYVRSLPDSVYKDLKELASYNDGQRIFTLNKDTVNDMMNRAVEIAQIPKERNIVFHSLKKFGVQSVFEENGNLEEARIQAGHDDINTTLIYIENKVNLKEQFSFRFNNENTLDVESYLHSLTKEQLINAVMKSSQSVRTHIMNLLNK